MNRKEKRKSGALLKQNGIRRKYGRAFRVQAFALVADYAKHGRVAKVLKRTRLHKGIETGIRL
jgi:hypothetical protein